MKLDVQRHRMLITPQGDLDIAYIEEVLGLKNEGDSVTLTRVNAMRLSCVAYLVAKREERPNY